MDEWYTAASRADNLFRHLQNITGPLPAQTGNRPNRFRNFSQTTPTTQSPPTNRPKKLTPEEWEKCLWEGRCLACREKVHNAKDCTKFPRTNPITFPRPNPGTSNIRQVAEQASITEIPATPTPAPAAPTSAADIMAHIHTLLQNAGQTVAKEVLSQIDNSDF